MMHIVLIMTFPSKNASHIAKEREMYQRSKIKIDKVQWNHDDT